jgi:hypothetical protein
MSNAFEATNGIIPIPLREDLTVRVWGLPADLTKAEAARIGAVIMALATPSTPDLGVAGE